jgi:hypothetical protein
MARAIGDVVDIKNHSNKWEWAIITGPQVAHSNGKMMYPFWNNSGYGKEFEDRIRNFTGSDLHRNNYFDQWEAEKLRLHGRGGNRKKSRRHKKKNRKTRRR